MECWNIGGAGNVLEFLFEDKRSDSRKGAKIAKMDKNSIGKTYLKLTGMKLGYLLNFGEDMMKRGITRTVNGLPE